MSTGGSKVVVVGAGLAGIASAVRLAKLGHDVTLLDRAPTVGGELVPFEHDGYQWPTLGASFTLPAALRDLFKKSGRPLAREVELVEHPTLREHHLPDGSRIALPGQDRPGVRAALEGLAPGLADPWLEWTDSQASRWELLRRHLLERRYVEQYTPKELTRLLRSRRSLAKDVAGLRDPRLQLLAQHHATRGGHDPRRVPAWLGVLPYLEQTFGSWSVPGEPGTLSGLLERRLAERKVEVRTDTTVADVAPGQVRTGSGTIAADAIVVACDPRSFPTLAKTLKPTLTAPAPQIHYLAVADPATAHHEIVLHEPTGQVTLATTGTGPHGTATAWTATVRGTLSRPLPDLLIARRLVGNATVVASRADTPGSGTAPYGVTWRRPRTDPIAMGLGVRSPLPGVYTAGAATTISPLLPFIVLTSTLVAAEFDTVARVRT